MTRSDWPRDARALLLALFLLGLAIGPRLDDDAILERRLPVAAWDWRGPFGILLNLDAFAYMEAARSPATLLQAEARLQARPLIPVLLHPVVRILDASLPGAGETGAAPAGATHAADDPGIVAPYVAWIGFNLALLVAALALFERVLARQAGADRVLIAGLSLLLVANPLTRAFLLQPHLQLWHLLLPLLALLAWRDLVQGLADGPRRALAWALACGVGLLAYAGFAIVAAVVAAGLLLRAVRGRPRAAAILLGGCALLLAPTLAWVALVQAGGTPFHNYEISRWRQVVWIADLWRSDGAPAVLAQLAAHAGALAGWALRFALPALLVVLPLLATRGVQALRAAGMPALRRALVPCIAVAALAIAFYAVVGLRVERLASAAGVALIVAVAQAAVATARLAPPPAWVRAWVWLAAIGAGAITLAADGPYV